MKAVLLMAVVMAADFCCCPAQAAERFFPPPVKLVWAAPTNNLRGAFWIYKVVPQLFSPAVISNALAMGNFSENNKARLKRKTHAIDKDALLFIDKEDTRYLTIAPSIGWIEYYDSNAKAPMGNPLVGVPNDEEVESLALECLFRLGIDRGQLADKPRARDIGRRGKLSPFGKKLTEEIGNRGIFFLREVDGVKFQGIGAQGGFYINFGNHGKITRYELVWRNLVPHAERFTAGPEQIRAWVATGKSESAVPPPDLSTARKLTITKVTPYYRGANGGEKQDFVSPYGELEVMADLSDTNVSFTLHCPITLP